MNFIQIYATVNMATKSNRIIFRDLKKPSPKAFLVSIPMNMYRIQTKKFKYGLDFFQKAVLSLKFNPKVTFSDIATYLGLEEDLVNLVVGELRYNDYIDDNGNLTQKGLSEKQNIDGLVINSNQEQIGYVFQFVDRNDYYRFYVKEIGDEPNLTDDDGIVVGTKGDGRDNYKFPYKLNFILEKKHALPPPNEGVLLDLISKTSRKGDIFEKLTLSQIRRSLSLKFFNNQTEPTLVSVCTYVYLPKSEEDGLYEPDWQVLDPFGNGDNSQLKFYLESFNDGEFKTELDKKFSDARTIAKKNFSDYSSFIRQETDKMREDDFDVNYVKLDKNLQIYLDSVMKNLFIFRQYNYQDFDSGDLFVISAQKAFETLFLIDEEKRLEIYNQMKKEFSTPANGDKKEYAQKRKNFFKQLIQSRMISMREPGRLISLASKVEPNRSNSLKQYIYNLILTYNYDNQSPLFKLIVGEIDNLFDIAELRNEKGHGKTESKGSVIMVSKENAESTYVFLYKFINKYINIVL